MSRKANIYGGGAQTNINGYAFEQTTSLNDYLLNSGFTIKNRFDVYYNDTFLGYSINKRNFTDVFLSSKGIDYLDFNSKRWDPDEAFINERNKTVYIIEKKFQQSSGSVDEKLATFPFKIFEYEKLLTPIGYSVQYFYLLSSKWFTNPKYNDYFTYMRLNHCPYYFDVFPLEAIGL